MKISIVTPVFNAEKTIERTILSVINQKCKSQIEYIIIDGGSQDNTLNILKRYSEQIDILISEKDRGTYDAMNKGISLATGDIVGIINADDWYNEGALESVEQVLMKYTDISIIHSPVNNYFNGKQLSTFQPGQLENLAFRFTIAHPSCFVKKSLYEQLGLFDLSYSIAADYDFIFRAYTSGAKFYCVDTPIASFSLDGISGKLINKLKLIYESWRVGSKYVREHSRQLKSKHNKYYLNWYLREIATLPIKYFDPFIAIKLKGFLRQKVGSFSSDKYGAW